MTAANIFRANDRLCVDSQSDASRRALIAQALAPAANAASASTAGAAVNEPLAMPRVDFVVRADALQNPALLERINAERLGASSLPLADENTRLDAQTRRIKLSSVCGRALRLGGEEVKSGRMSRCSRLNMKVRRPFEALLRGLLKSAGRSVRTITAETPRILSMPSEPFAILSAADTLSSSDAASDALLFDFSLSSLELIARLRREGVANPIAVRGIIFDDRQLAAVAASGADAVLFSMSLLSAAGFESLSKSAALLGLEAGAEAESVDGILNAVRLNAPVISIRSIDDEDPKENLARISAIGDFVPPHAVLVAGAGINSEKSLRRVERMVGRTCIAVEDAESAQEEAALRLAAS